MKTLLERPTSSFKLGGFSTQAFRHICVAVFGLILMVLTTSPKMFGQGITGSITGRVTDPSGAPIQGATVTAHQVQTNADRTINSSDAGTFVIPQLAPGKYTLTVTSNGFQSYRQENITLVIDQVIDLDVKLTIGGGKETITVTDTPPVLQTEESSVGQVIGSEAIQNAPLNGRLSLMGLVAQAPGLQGVGAQDQLATRGMTFAAGTGSRNSYGGLGSTLDGVTNAEVTLQRAEPEVPSLDAISQFKVLSTGSPAEFGQPTQVIVVSASGTNAFHGELLEYNRSKGTSAKQYFAGSKPRPAYERNEFGGNFAGPVVIPHLYNGKDRTFFFFAYEGFRLNQSSNANTVQPTVKMRSGDFSELSTKIIDPATGQPFSGNVIPSARLNSVSLNLMKLLMPVPTTSAVGATNTYELIPYTSTSTRISLHMDHKLGANDQIRGTLLRADYGPNPTTGSDSLQGGKSGDGEKNTNIILGWTHTFSPTMILDTNGSFFHLPIYRAPQNINTKWESIIPGLATQYIEGAPHLSFKTIQSTGESGSHDLEQIGQINTSVTKILSKHAIKIGFGYLYDNHFNVAAEYPNYEHGLFKFTGNYTGYDVADFMLGLPTTSAQGSPGSFVTRNISSQWAAYIQDDWKVLPKLTINVGVRYDLQWFSPGPYNNASLWVPSVGKVVVFGSSYPSSIIPSSQALLSQYNLLALSSDVKLSNNVFSFLGRPNKNLAPRVGFAYEVLPNTVVRGAFGIYFNLLPASYVGSMFGTAPFLDYSTYTNTPSYSSSTFTMSNAFAASASGHGGNPAVNAEAPLKTPYTEEYNLAVEHQFAHGFDVRIGYVGQHNVKQNNAQGNGNTAPDINLPSPPVLTQTQQAQRPIQPLSSISLNMAPIFHSTMNSLQVGVHKQYSQGLALGAEYQWVRVLGTENIQDPSGANPNDSSGPVAGITPQVLQVNYSYELPMGKGKMLFNDAGTVTNALVRGWQVSGLVNAQTGQPFSVTFDASGSSAYPGLVSGRANRVPGVALYPTKKSKSQWFNPAAFSCPLAPSTSLCGGSYGNSGYDLLRGPAFQDWDISLQKNTRWMERYNVQLRADAFNVFNHPNLGVPNADISNTKSVGTITSTSGTPGYEARTMEFAIKFSF